MSHLEGLPEPTDGELLMMDLWAAKLQGQDPYVPHEADSSGMPPSQILPFRLDRI